jgi:hypothetical protein
VLLLAGITIFLMPNWVFMFVTMGFIAMSIAEFFSIVENRGIFVYKYFGIVAGCVILFLFISSSARTI